MNARKLPGLAVRNLACSLPKTVEDHRFVLVLGWANQPSVEMVHLCKEAYRARARGRRSRFAAVLGRWSLLSGGSGRRFGFTSSNLKRLSDRESFIHIIMVSPMRPDSWI